MYYTYLIGWSKFQKYYYGVRFSKKASPDELWKTYFTSSKHVKKFREQNGEPDIIQVRKIFTDSKKARLWEAKVLKRMNVVRDDKWLNKTDNVSIDSRCAILGASTKPSVETRLKMSIAASGKIFSDERRMKISESNKGKVGYWKGKTIPDDVKAKISSSLSQLKGEKNGFFGKKHSEETKKKISETKRLASKSQKL